MVLRPAILISTSGRARLSERAAFDLRKWTSSSESGVLGETRPTRVETIIRIAVLDPEEVD